MNLKVSNWADMRQFGINALTGESCGYNLRLLCDLSEQGKELVQRYLGLPMETPMFSNWNQYVGEAGAVSCMMLNKDSLVGLAMFCMFVKGCVVVLRSDGGELIGLDSDDERYEAYMGLAEKLNWGVHPNYSRPERNQHAMTGRTV